ncbi:MAG: beta-lactamase family protein [Cyclobacteriaceae bacterium]|nr:beta-lactamase family protein [Cyclobacteriaceae bacterium]
MTKAVTSVGIMQLFEQGKIGLDDPLHWYLPEYKEMVVLDTFEESDSSFTTKPAEKDITIRHLLTHTSGITYGDFNPGKIAAVYSRYDMLGVGLSHEEWTTQEFIKRLAKVPLVFEPGEKFLYGLNTDVLGRVIEVVSGLTLAQYFQEHIFDKVGMSDTHFYLPKNKQKRLVPLYTTTEDNGLSIAEGEGSFRGWDYPKAIDNGHYSGGGGLSSTALDYAKFIQALLNDGRYNDQQLLAAHTIDLIKADQLIALNREGKGISQTPGISFGLGFMVWLDEAEGVTVKSPGTYEWAGLFNTKYFIDPAEDLIFVGMTQVLPFTQEHFWEKLYTVIYGSLED